MRIPCTDSQARETIQKITGLYVTDLKDMLTVAKYIPLHEGIKHNPGFYEWYHTTRRKVLTENVVINNATIAVVDT